MDRTTSQSKPTKISIENEFSFVPGRFGKSHPLVSNIKNKFDGNQLLLQGSSSKQDFSPLINSSMDNRKELGDALFDHYTSLKELEKNVKNLKFKKSKIEENISRLQGSTVYDGFDSIYKNVVMENIISYRDSAASMVCGLFRSSLTENRYKDFAGNIFGVVALLGTVQSREISRMLSEFIGVEDMLAVVSKSCSTKFNDIVSSLGFSVKGQYRVICLEHSRPYNGPIGKDPQRRLCLPNPVWNGKLPEGYIGHAVNLINLDRNHLTYRTNNGHGIRGVLFYPLFGNLQVYKDRGSMNQAILNNCVKSGAVSLDGGIFRENGSMASCFREPTIQFPVVSALRQQPYPFFKAKSLEMIEEMNTELRNVNMILDAEMKKHEKTMRKFIETRDKYNQLG